MITQKKLKKLIHYDHLTGKFTWLITVPKQSKTCSAGRDDGREVAFTVMGRKYLAQDLAWFYFYGEWPNGMLYMLDGDYQNFAIANLSLKPCIPFGWKQVYYEGYDFSNYWADPSGWIWSSKKKILHRLKGNVCGLRKEYLQVALSDEEDPPNKRQITVHRLIANAFIPNPDNLPEVCHKVERIPPDNSIDNLFWSDHKGNMADMANKGRNNPHWNTFTEEEVLSARMRHKTGKATINELRMEHDVSWHTMSRMIKGITYGWIK